MQKSIFTLLIMSLSFVLSAQTKGKINPGDKTTITKKYPIKGGQIKGEQQPKPYLHDLALTKCERYLRYYKRMWKVVLISSPTSIKPLRLSKEISRLRILTVPNSTGHIVFDKTPGTVTYPPLSTFIDNPFNANYPVPVTSSVVLTPVGNSTVGFAWETGSYANIVDVKDIYKIGTQVFAELKRSNGALSSIMIFPQHMMDGCEIPTR